MNKNFWQLIGLRRSRSFFIVLAINAVFLAGLLLWLLPQQEAAEAALAQSEQEKLALQNQIVELPKKFEQMKNNEAQYDVLTQGGFFAEQDRIMFRQMLSSLRDSSGVRQVAYDIKPQQTIENQALINTDKQLLKSDVTVSLRGLTDLEMRGFVQALQNAVPGVSAISKQYFKRLDDLNDANLIRLGNGEAVDFVESGYSFSWYTLYDKNDPYGMKAGMAGDPAHTAAPPMASGAGQVVAPATANPAPSASGPAPVPSAPATAAEPPIQPAPTPVAPVATPSTGGQ